MTDTNKLEQYDKAFYGHPKPLIGTFLTDLWERFSYYGILPILVLYMSATVVEGGLGLDRTTAAAIIGLFAGSMYLITIFGGWIADNWLGVERAVWYGCIIIALGHLSIALTPLFDQFFFYLGLVFLVLGSGLFKTSMVIIEGNIYANNDPRRDSGFSILYMAVNIGGFTAPLITGLLIENNNWHLGFGIGGLGMLIALMTFRFITIPQLEKLNQLRQIQSTWNSPIQYNSKAPKVVIAFLILLAITITLIALDILVIDPLTVATYFTVIVCLILIGYFAYLILSPKTNTTEKKQLFTCFILLMVSALFWAAFDQQYIAFNFFAQDYIDRNVLGFEIPILWFQAINPVFIVIFAPFFAWLWLKLDKKKKNPSYITKFIIALLFAALGFILMIWASHSVMSSDQQLVSPLWLVAILLLFTLGELCLSPIGLSMVTHISPQFIQGQVMGLWFAATALGKLVAGLIGGHLATEKIENFPDVFIRCIFILVICAVILYLFKKPLLNMMSDHHETSS